MAGNNSKNNASVSVQSTQKVFKWYKPWTWFKTRNIDQVIVIEPIASSPPIASSTAIVQDLVTDSRPDESSKGLPEKKSEIMGFQLFKDNIDTMHQENVGNYLMRVPSIYWKRTMLDQVIVRVTDSYNKYYSIYTDKSKPEIQRSYSVLRMQALEKWATEDGYKALVNAIQKMFEMVIHKFSYNSISHQAFGNETESAQNTLLLAGILNENAQAEENFYASIYLLQMVSCASDEKFVELMVIFKKYFIEAINLSAPTRNLLMTAADKNTPGILDAYNELTVLINGCDRTEIESLFIGDDKEYKQKSHRSTSCTSSRDGISNSSSTQNLMSSGFELFTRKFSISFNKPVRSSSSSSSSSSALTDQSVTYSSSTNSMSAI